MRATGGVFVTGTDTGVGKTIVCGVILRGLLARGIRAGAMKPFETGCPEVDGRAAPQDGLFLREMAEMGEPLEVVVPERFAPPVSPLVAARLEGREIDVPKVIETFFQLRGAYDAVVVEGAGGLLVPVAMTAKGRGGAVYFIADLVRDLGLPLVVVARPGLGTINHTLLTIRQALADGIVVKGVVMNYAQKAVHDLAEETNMSVLGELSPVPILGTVPHVERISKDALEGIAESCLDLDRVL
ncbi:MAG: dethiobiotin synthase [Chloroflexota bacterium]